MVWNSLALTALGGQIKNKMIHQLDSRKPVCVAATAAAPPTKQQLAISTSHTWLVYIVVMMHLSLSDGIH